MVNNKKINSRKFTTKKLNIDINKKAIIKPNVAPKLQKHDVLFDCIHLKKLLYGDNFMQNVQKYINTFFFKYGSKVFYDNGQTFDCLTLDDAKRKIPDEYERTFTINQNGRIKNVTMKLNSYFSHEMFIATPDTKLTIDYKQDIKFNKTEHIRGFDQVYKCLNMKKDLPRDYSKKIEQTEFNKAGLKAFFDHIKLIICSNIEEEYETTIKVLASSVMGHKVKIALLWQSKEQTGKGTVLNTLDNILGDRMYKTSDVEQVEKYTKNFEGCTLLNFDELPTHTKDKKLQDKMKAQITEDTFDCRGMYQAPYVQKNTFNIIITSNNNCMPLTITNHKRYYLNTINNDFIGNTKYFNKLYSYINNVDVQILIYQEFERIFNEKVKPTNWIGNDVKQTLTGKIKQMEALPQFHKYVKDNYIKYGYGIDQMTTEFLEAYKQTDKYATPHRIGALLKEFGVIIKKFNTNNNEPTYRKYIISFEDLRNYYSSKGWINEEYDEIPEIATKKTPDIKQLQNKIKQYEKKDKLTKKFVNDLDYDEFFNEINDNDKRYNSDFDFNDIKPKINEKKFKKDKNKIKKVKTEVIIKPKTIKLIDNMVYNNESDDELSLDDIEAMLDA